jgi:hypothetical protein
MFEVILKRFEKPDETRLFEKGRFDIVRIGGMTVGRATYEPGWKWSEHVAPIAGASLCGVEHVGMVVSGRAVAHSAPSARQLGDRRRALRVATFPWRGPLHEMKQEEIDDHGNLGNMAQAQIGRRGNSSHA